MKILWLHQYFATPQGWGAVRTYEFARRFVRSGHAVDVVCCAGYDESLRSVGGKPHLVEGVRVFVSGTEYGSRMGFLRRVYSFLRFMVAAVWFVLRRGRGYDLVIASSGPLTMAVPALVGRWVWRKPFLFEVIDVWPDSAIAAGVLRNPVLKWLSFRLARLAYKYAACIVTCSTGMSERVEGYCEKSVAAGSIVTIPNCCDLEQFVVAQGERTRLREKYGVGEGQMVVLYAGALGRSNAVEDVLEAMEATAHDERILWWVAGEGVMAPAVAAVAERRRAAGQGGVRWFGQMAKSEVVELYKAADVNVVTFRHEPLFYENSPNKFFDGIAAGVLAVFNRSTWLEPWLEKYGCGVVCEAGRRGIAAVLVDLAGDAERRQRMSVGARRLAREEFDRERLAQEMVLAGTKGHLHHAVKQIGD